MSPSPSSSSSSSTLLVKINNFLTDHHWIDFRTYKGYDSALVRTNLHLHSATLLPTPVLTTHWTITKDLCNPNGDLHCGATATIFDVVTTLAIWLVADLETGYWEIPGVSRQMDVVYLDAVKAGEELEVTGEVVRAGRRMVQLRGVMRRRRDGRVVVATCEHAKMAVDVGRAKM